MIKDTTKTKNHSHICAVAPPACPIKPSYNLSKPSLWQGRLRGISIPIHYLNCSVCFALWEGFLHHGPSNRAVLVGNGLAHALHGDVRRIGIIRTEANDNQRELKNKNFEFFA
jgi:hypothetical protein